MGSTSKRRYYLHRAVDRDVSESSTWLSAHLRPWQTCTEIVRLDSFYSFSEDGDEIILIITGELDTVINFTAKQSISRLMETTPKAVKDHLITNCANILACYRKNCATPSSP